MKNKKQKKIVSFVDVVGIKGGQRCKTLSELLNRSFVITGVQFGEDKYGKYAIVTTSDGEHYKTYSSVLVQQLAMIQTYLEDYEDEVAGVHVTLKKRKRYYTFD